MKKILLPLLSLFISAHAYSVSPQDIDTAIYKLSKQISINEINNYEMSEYAELKYLKRIHHLMDIKTNDSTYLRNMVFNNYYYDRFYLYGKFFNDSAVVTEDCLNIPGTTADWRPSSKLIFYALYPIKIPHNYLEQLDSFPDQDNFYGKYKALDIIYYLKKYNYNNLSASQKAILPVLEKKLSDFLFKNYIENKPWSTYKLLSIKVLKMNNNALVNGVDISDLVKYYKDNNRLNFFEEDRKYISTLQYIGGKTMVELIGNALLWIFLLENK